MKRKLFVLIAIISMLFSACGQFGDPMPEDMWTRNVAPGYDSIYSVGGNGTEYAEGWFDQLYSGGLPVCTGNCTGGAGVATDAFGTIDVDAGTNPVADAAPDVLQLTSHDGSVYVEGNEITDQVSLEVVSDGHSHTGGTLSGIDISSDTNLGAHLPLVLTGDWLNLPLLAGHFFVGNTSNEANDVIMGGDGQLTDTGLLIVINDSHDHTGATLSGIDISDDTNLAALAPLNLTDDTIGLIAFLPGLIALNSGHILVGNATNQAADVEMTGDVTITLTGATTVGDDSHNHTSSTIAGLDISADTNMAVTSPITLTGDTVGIGNASTTAKGAATFDDLYFSASSGNISLTEEAVPNSLALGTNFMMVPVNAGWLTLSSGTGAAVYQQPFRLCIGSGTAASGYSYAYSYLFGYQAANQNIRYFNFDKKFIFNFNIDKGVVTDGVGRIQIKDESVAININDLSMPGIGIEINNADLIWESYGAHRQETDSGVNLTAFAKNRITIVLTPGANRTIKFYIDGVLNYTETDTAHVPSGTGVSNGYVIASLAGGAVHPDNYLSMMEPWMWQDSD